MKLGVIITQTDPEAVFNALRLGWGVPSLRSLPEAQEFGRFRGVPALNPEGSV